MGRMLKAVTKGKQAAPLRELVYGVEGVGKTTFGADAPSPIFLGEDGTKRLDVARFPVARSWKDVTDAVTELGREKHDYRTVCIDTLDHLEGLVFAAVCAREERASIADVPFNRGPDYALDFWRDLLRELEQLQEKTGMHVILLAHAAVKTFKNPMGDDWDRFTLKIHEKAASLIRGWAQSVLFASYDVSVKKAQKRDTKGKADGVARYLYTQRIPAADAKNRYDLPARIDLSFTEFARLLERGDPERAKQLRESALELLDQVVDPTKKARATEALEKAGTDLKALRTVIGKLNATIEEQDLLAVDLEQAAADPEGSAPEGVGAPAEGSVSSAAASSSSPASAAGHGGGTPSAPERKPAPAASSSQPGEKKPGEAAPRPPVAPSAPPPAAAAPWVAPTGPVTVAEVLAWIGETQVAHAEEAVKILADPKAFPASDTPPAIASLMVVNGVDRNVVDAWWKAAAGTLTRKGAYAPMSGMEFVQLWYEVRAHEPPPRETEEQVAKQLGLETARS